MGSKVLMSRIWRAKTSRLPSRSEHRQDTAEFVHDKSEPDRKKPRTSDFQRIQGDVPKTLAPPPPGSVRAREEMRLRLENLKQRVEEHEFYRRSRQKVSSDQTAPGWSAEAAQTLSPSTTGQAHEACLDAVGSEMESDISCESHMQQHTVGLHSPLGTSSQQLDRVSLGSSLSEVQAKLVSALSGQKSEIMSAGLPSPGTSNIYLSSSLDKAQAASQNKGMHVTSGISSAGGGVPIGGVPRGMTPKVQPSPPPSHILAGPVPLRSKQEPAPWRSGQAGVHAESSSENAYMIVDSDIQTNTMTSSKAKAANDEQTTSSASSQSVGGKRLSSRFLEQVAAVEDALKAANLRAKLEDSAEDEDEGPEKSGPLPWIRAAISALSKGCKLIGGHLGS